MIRNMPCELGRNVGEMLAKFADAAMPEYAASFAEDGKPVPQRCRTCAFRLGTHAHGCLTTTADALKCVMELVDFCCHEKDAMTSEGPMVCVGWAMLISDTLRKGGKTLEMPWQFSDEPQKEFASP